MVLRVKEAQLLEALNNHQFLDEQIFSIIKETQLVSADLCHRLDAQVEEGEKLMQIIEGMHRGEGLNFSTLINTLGFKEIRVYLLQSSSDQILEKLMEYNPNLEKLMEYNLDR